MEIVGYHGTSGEAARKIVQEGFRTSDGPNWFGPGVYFFESNGYLDGYTEAKQWALYVKKFPVCALVKARIQAQNYIDLILNVEHRKVFELICKETRKLFAEKKSSSEFSEATIYIKIREKMPNLELIRAMTDGSSLNTVQTTVRPQIQVCVIKTDSIRSQKLAWEGQNHGRRN